MTTGSKTISGAFLPGKTFTVRNQTETKQCDKLCNLYDKQYSTICRGIDREKIVWQRKLRELHNDKTQSEDREAFDSTIQGQIKGKRRKGLFLSNGSNRTAIPLRKYYTTSLDNSKKEPPVTPVLMKARQMLQSKTVNSSRYEFSDSYFEKGSVKDLAQNDSSQSPRNESRRRSSTISVLPRREQEKEEVRMRRNTFSGISSFGNSPRDYSFHSIAPLVSSPSYQYSKQEFSRNSSDDLTFSDTEEQHWGKKVSRVQKMKIKLNLDLLKDCRHADNSQAQNLKGSYSVREYTSNENDTSTKRSSQNGSVSDRKSMPIVHKHHIPRSLESSTGVSIDSPTESVQTSSLGEEMSIINDSLQNVHTTFDTSKDESKEIEPQESPAKRKVSFSENVEINNVKTIDIAMNSHEKSSQNEVDNNNKLKNQKKHLGLRRNSETKLSKVAENAPRDNHQNNISYSESWKNFKRLNTTVNSLKKQMHEAVYNIKSDQASRNKGMGNVNDDDNDVFERDPSLPTSSNSTVSEENSADEHFKYSLRSLSVTSSKPDCMNRNSKVTRKMSFTEKRALKRRPSQQLLKIFEANQQNLPMADLMELQAERRNAKLNY